MTKISLEDIEIIKILAVTDTVTLFNGMNKDTRERLDSQVGMILREYYKENTTNIKTGWTEEFERAGITEDQGKSAIACGRRLGMEIY